MDRTEEAKKKSYPLLATGMRDVLCHEHFRGDVKGKEDDEEEDDEELVKELSSILKKRPPPRPLVPWCATFPYENEAEESDKIQLQLLSKIELSTEPVAPIKTQPSGPVLMTKRSPSDAELAYPQASKK